MSAHDLLNGDPSVDMESSSESETSVTFEVIEQATNKGRKLLLDSRGYNYCVKRLHKNKVYWRCCLRTTSITCNASVVQVNNTFSTGCNDHVHPPTATLQTARLVSKQICVMILVSFSLFSHN